MDSTGVPQKINRQVIKALFQNSRDGLKFGELLEYVRICNRNLKPVANLSQTVHKAMENFQRIGLILRDDKHRYKISTSKPSASSRRMFTEGSCSAAHNKSVASNYWKRKSDESIQGVDAENGRKRLKSQNYVGNRDKQAINLPRNKRTFAGRLNFPTNCLFPGNYDDESLLREPGDDDRDSGDDLCVRVDYSQNHKKADDSEQNTNPDEASSPQPGADKQQGTSSV